MYFVHSWSPSLNTSNGFFFVIHSNSNDIQQISTSTYIQTTLHCQQFNTRREYMFLHIWTAVLSQGRIILPPQLLLLNFYHSFSFFFFLLPFILFIYFIFDVKYILIWHKVLMLDITPIHDIPGAISACLLFPYAYKSANLNLKYKTKQIALKLWEKYCSKTVCRRWAHPNQSILNWGLFFETLIGTLIFMDCFMWWFLLLLDFFFNISFFITIIIFMILKQFYSYK